ncbi:CAAX prenyl protease 2 isoform X3 [Antechinus flavipes]|uniref:CAAX prenyl protease 2 isoform X3 n=1 Tax=Antechinus flavipes TaxID=38775 RepID=UPI00223610F5|nr:CAAX prenyl protease 2 isoform X3 [Antechinus flavipes]
MARGGGARGWDRSEAGPGTDQGGGGSRGTRRRGRSRGEAGPERGGGARRAQRRSSVRRRDVALRVPGALLEPPERSPGARHWCAPRRTPRLRAQSAMAALGGDGLRLLSVSGPEPEPESAALNGAGPGLCCWVSVCSCLSLACSYVGSLYVWKSELPRDHPAVIKRRFTSVLVVSSLSPLCVLLWQELTGLQPGISLFTLMGVRLEGIFPAALLPLLLTMILFLGPLMQLSLDCPWDLANGLKVALAPQAWMQCLTDMRWLRNQVIAPLTEELVFRACMLPMLAPCTGLGPAVFTCPLFFGVGQCGQHLPVGWSPDRAGALSLFLQLHGLPGRVCGPGASPEVPAAAGLRPGRGALRPAAAAPHRTQTVQQPPPLPAPGPGRGLGRPPVLLTSAPSLWTLGAPGERGGVRGGGLGTGAS